MFPTKELELMKLSALSLKSMIIYLICGSSLTLHILTGSVAFQVNTREVIETLFETETESIVL